MKKYIMLIAFTISSLLVQGQSKYEEQQKVFSLALQFNDIQSAKTAVYQMMVLKPENQVGLLDTLSMLFYASNDYENCVKTTSLLLSKTPEKLSLVEMRAKSLQRLGYIKESLKDYELLYAKTSQDMFLYEILVSQYQLKRYGEAEQSSNKLLTSKSDTLKVDVQLGQGQYQSVSLKSAVSNIKGVVAMEVGQKEVAKQWFEKALTIDSDFILPKNNLKLISAEKEPVKEEKQAEEPKKKKR